MTITPRLPLVAAALLSLLAPLVLSADPAQATAPARAAAPTTAIAAVAAVDLNAFTLPGADNPLTVDSFDPADPPQSPDECIAAGTDRYDPACYNVGLSMRPSEAVSDVTVAVVESDGLYVDPLVTTFDTIEADSPELLRYAVRARTPGLHTLTLEITATGAETRRLSLPYVWTPGGAPIAGNDSLAGRLYGANTLQSYPCAPEGSCTYRQSYRKVFLTHREASTHLALEGRRVCGTRPRCSSYHYDEATGLVQIGTGTIGLITRRSTFIDGERYARMVYPRPGRHLDGRWSYGAAVDEGRGVVEQHLRLRSNGRFRLSFAVDTHRYPDSGIDSSYSRTSTGTYRIGRNGRIAFTSAGRPTRVATLAVVANPAGKPRASSRGIWLDLSIDPPTGRSFVDGNRLYPL